MRDGGDPPRASRPMSARQARDRSAAALNLPVGCRDQKAKPFPGAHHRQFQTDPGRHRSQSRMACSSPLVVQQLNRHRPHADRVLPESVPPKVPRVGTPPGSIKPIRFITSTITTSSLFSVTVWGGPKSISRANARRPSNPLNILAGSSRTVVSKKRPVASCDSAPLGSVVGRTVRSTPRRARCWSRATGESRTWLSAR